MSTKKQALIIDDDSSISMLLEAMLAKMDYQCTQAETAEIALDILKNKSFLLIITDYMLPGMNGILFMKRVKKLYPNQSVIIMSGYGNQINYQDIINAGASDYLKKPIERAELTSRILRIEREYDILKELQETNLKLESVLNNANALTSEMIDNQDELANILKYNTDAAMVVDENFTIINVNEQFLSLFSIVDPPLEGKKCYDIFPNSFCSKEDCVVKPIVEGANKVEKEKEYISPDNIRIPCKITAFPFKEKTGKLKGIINIYKDLREKELEKDKGIVLGMLQSSAKVGKQKVDKLNQIYQRMDRYYLELKQTEKRLKNSEKELRILNNISKILLTTQDITLFDKVLKLILEQFNSCYGFFGYINSQNKLVFPISSNLNQTNCKVNPPMDVSNHVIINQWKAALKMKKSLCLHQEFNLPKDHIAIASMLVVPIISNDDAIGLFVLANTSNAYTQQDQHNMEIIAKFIAPVLQARIQQQKEERERIKAEIALKVSHAYRDRIIQSMIDALLVIDTDGIINEANSAAFNLFGYTEKELIYSPFTKLINKNFSHKKNILNTLPHVLIKLAQEKNTIDYELICYHKNGSTIPVIFSANVMYDESQNIMAYVCVLRDIRGLQDTTARLIEAEKLAALGELTGGIGHELKQPMNVIKITTQSILMDIKRDRFEQDMLGDDLRQITTQVDKMASIIDHMRIFTRRSHDLEKEKVDINELIKTTYQFFNQQMQAHNIDFIMNLYPDLHLVNVDPIRLEEVLVNLISNGRKALEKSMCAEKRIVVNTYNETDTNMDETFVFIEVEDNGEGIPEHLADKLFDQFFTTHIPGEGMGLGLSISRKIIEDHQGKLSFNNKSEGGALFRIKLPACVD